MLASFRRWLVGVSMALGLCLGLPPGCSLPEYEFRDPPAAEIVPTRTACRRDADCAALRLTRTCDTDAGWCVECLPALEPESTQCGAGLFCTEASRCAIGCNDDSDCNGGLSCNLETRRCTGCDAEGDCVVGTACEASVCVPHCASDSACPAGFACCSGACANPLGDPLHCGACGAVCADAEECINGECGSSGCPFGFADCDRKADNGCEAKLADDERNCGGCGTDCAPGFCSGGRCSGVDCGPGRANCDGAAGNACEADLGSVETCGLCTQRCAAINGTAACTSERCSIVCQPGYDDCDGNSETGCETAVASEVANCGTCGTVCANDNGSTRCNAGVCVPECATGFDDCDGDPTNGCETALDEDLEACGACGVRCALDGATEDCDLGVCSIRACEPGFEDCDGDAKNGCEADLSSPETCGACDNQCSSNGGTPICSPNGSCAIECDPGREDCSGGLADGCETNLLADVRHCGRCGRACTAPNGSTPACAAGECSVSECVAPFADCRDESSAADTTCETNVNNDPLNCGGCGIECFYANGTGRCDARTCALSGCNAGRANCDAELSNGCETLLGTVANCRQCGETCANAHGTTSCTPSGCRPSCQLGWEDCDGRPENGCETPLNTAQDCGACGRTCARPHATASCASGVCSVVQCDAGWGSCDDSLENGCETSLLSNTDCGACDVPCTQPNGVASCSNGSCGLRACNSGYADCSSSPSAPGCETRLGTAQNCDGCGNVCQTQNVHVMSNVCAGGTSAWDCAATCAAGWKSCDNDPDDGCETDISSPANCGDCGAVCNLPNTGAHQCVSATCQVSTCDAGWANCNTSHVDGCERPVNDDVANCGDCNRVCSSNNGTPGCDDGACTISCATGFGNCDNEIADGCEHDTSSDPLNCGTCGTICPSSTPFCVNRACRPKLDVVVRSTATGSVATTGTNLRLRHTLVSAANTYRAVFVAVAGRGNSPNARPSQVTYDNRVMTLAREATLGQVHAAIYYLTEPQLPDPGSYDVVVTAANSQNTFGFIANVVELTGVERGPAAIDASAAVSSGNCAPVSTQINVLTTGAVAYGILSIDGSATPANLQASGQTPTMAQTTIPGSLGAAAGRLAPAARTGAFEFSWTQPSSCNGWKHVVVAIKPAVTR